MIHNLRRVSQLGALLPSHGAVGLALYVEIIVATTNALGTCLIEDPFPSQPETLASLWAASTVVWSFSCYLITGNQIVCPIAPLWAGILEGWESQPIAFTMYSSAGF